MLLNYLFVAFFLVGSLVALGHVVLTGDTQLLTDLVNSTFDASVQGFELALALTGVLAFWLGMLNIAQESGAMQRISRTIAPVLGAFFPSVPKDHPAMSHIFMNISANLLGLNNAATPMGLKAMDQLQTLNPHKEKASDAQIMFIIISASGLTLIPTSIMAYRMQAGAANPSDVFLPILMATLTSTLVGVTLTCLKQRISLLQPKIGRLLLGVALFLALIVVAWKFLPADRFSKFSSALSASILLLVICSFLISGLRARINVYEAFIRGAKGGFRTAITIVPYLVAILVAIAFFRTSGAMQYVIASFTWVFSHLGLEVGWVDALPTMIMKPFSGGASAGLMVDAMNQFGADSLVGRIACSAQGATDTTMYIIALYFGSVRVSRTRYTLGYSLLADLAGLTVSVPICYLFFQ